MQTVSFTVNGQPVVATVPGDLTLIRFLRDDHHLTGTKEGCSNGDCWACTVLIDGVPTRACLTRVSRLDGCVVETIDGLARDGVLHPLQQAFIDHGAVQCGFCTPGMIMHAKALLDRNPSPTEAEIVEALGDHLCRCTGYVSIVRAVGAAAAVLRGERAPGADQPSSVPYGQTILGASMLDKDGAERVTGQLTFADDLYFDGMLFGKILFASQPHAEILSIDTSRAEAMPGVRAVLTGADVPGKNTYGASPPPDRPVLCDRKVRNLGDMVAVVFADTLKQAKQAVGQIDVTYRPLEVVATPQRALEDGAPLVHEHGNLVKQASIRKGDVAEGFGAADVVVEGHYETPFIEHAYLEPEAGVARPSGDGGVEIFYPSQAPFASRHSVARSLGLPRDKVRIIATPAGGAFGGKVEVMLEIVLALGALKTGRPVKITLTRAESLRASGKKHPYYMDFKIGARKDGTFLALQATLVADAGAYDGISPEILEQSVVLGPGPYRWPHVQVQGCAVHTNNPSATGCRGAGLNQPNFGLESTLDMLARALKMDPIELRLKNALDEGDVSVTGERLGPATAVKATLREARQAMQELRPLESTKRIGVGVAAGFKNIGTGRGGKNVAGAVMELKSNGEVLLRASAVDIGQGARTVLAQIAAAETGVSYDRIKIITGDTAMIPPGALAGGQRQTYVAGNAVFLAAREFKQAVRAYLAQQYDVAAERIEIEGEHVVDRGSDNRVLINLAELGLLTTSENEVLRGESTYEGPVTYPIEDDASPRQGGPADGIAYDKDGYRNYMAYNYVTQVAVVEVDEQTGEVRLRRIISCHDVGRALNPQKIQGQLEGSAVMGMGYGLTEQFVLDEGQNRTSTLKRCGIPTMRDIPEVVLRVYEEPDAEGPFGAKGVAESAMVPTAAAVANAICDAVGARVRCIPATKERVLAAIRDSRDQP
ncbi:MAG: xanthine dehydrogenase [Chloroflexota bacterium]|nr:MAG: xanthine dehydrogenase [Chloroflexota bacterium]